jgi:hypothetical protein
MPRLSLWKDGKKTNDYKFMDKRIHEMFTVGGTGINVHKYLGPIDQGDTGDATKPSYLNQSEQNIQDLLFVENRDRKYDSDVYNMRGIYNRGDQDFDLSQFGIFLSAGTTFMVFHYNDMIETLGRKLIAGDVLEFMHLRDDHPLDDDVPAALKRYYVVGDASFAAEGFTPTWWPHLWRVKLNPLVDSQEYKDILNKIKVGDTDTPIADILSTYDKYLGINDAVIEQAESEVPASGYDTSTLLLPRAAGEPTGVTADSGKSVEELNDVGNATADSAPTTIYKKPTGYLTSDGLAPNGENISAGISFPESPIEGNYFLRLDYLPNRLFRYNGSRWVKVEDAVRTSLTNNSDDNKTLRASFTHNTSTYNDLNGDTMPVKQSLSKAFTPKADN